MPFILLLLALFLPVLFSYTVNFQCPSDHEEAVIILKGTFPPYHQDCFNRYEIVEIVNYLNFTAGVEVGVQRGIFAKQVLASFWPKADMYYLVDMWKNQAIYLDSANVNDNEQEQIFQEAKRNMAPFVNRTTFVRNSSLEAAKLFEDESVDFVYLDARHDYCGVTEDLVAWYPKLRVGGILAGHDFLTADVALSLSRGRENWFVCANGTSHQGAVKGAVIDFACLKHLDIFHTRDKPPSWYFSRKP